MKVINLCFLDNDLTEPPHNKSTSFHFVIHYTIWQHGVDALLRNLSCTKNRVAGICE